MRILYATQATGNGHLIRATELVPQLRKYAKVDVLMSGYQGDIELPFKVKYQYRGLSYMFGKNGKLNVLSSLRHARIMRLLKDVNSFPAYRYHAIISDFEPVSAWAAKLNKIPCLGLSHQASFMSENTPRPKKRDLLGELLLKKYAPIKSYLGFHFDSYDEQIISPIIRKEVRALKTITRDHITVYLPAFSHKHLTRLFTKFKDTNFHIFSKTQSCIIKNDNCTVYPISQDTWLLSLSSSTGVIMGAGFEGPSEALYLGKKLMVVPMKGQYEQDCNAAALARKGVTVLKDLEKEFESRFATWLKEEPIKIDFPDHVEELTQRIITFFEIQNQMVFDVAR
ncbi:glycosyltransferase family protein [Portibacter lacus]|uniref:Glycosyl transferase n=1 Tax=Portibacter lacus TaxID=1099794 RepID=A0AA37SPC7_9BACT|nr:glycosyltransferase family protein [Portibacter lacus]GLR16263.1 glycosyl transferase [Portibacter lacus]